MKLAKSVIPTISETESTALNCGTVSIDGEIFNGTMSPDKLKTSTLTDEEQSYIDNEVQELCELHMKLGYDGDKLHSDTLAFMKKIGIFGLNIPKEYGGKGFSPAGNSAIVTKLSSTGHNGLAVTAMVPNSLGPGELLQQYGTDVKKANYLPKLASG